MSNPVSVMFVVPETTKISGIKMSYLNLSSFSYVSYEPFTHGRVLHFLHNMLPGWLADTVDNIGDTSGTNTIYSYGRIFAKYTWDKDGNPLFNFCGDYAEIYNKIQSTRRDKIIGAY